MTTTSFRLRAHDAGHVLRQQAVIGHPGMTAVKVGFHAELRPILQFLLDVFARSFRLKPERVTAEIDRRAAIGGWRNMKLRRETAASGSRASISAAKLADVSKATAAIYAPASGVSSRCTSASAFAQSMSSTRCTESQSSPSMRS